MQSSLVGVTYDLLEFEGYGNFAKFDRLFSKACAFLTLRLDDAYRRKLRNIAFRYLRNTGYLDVRFTDSETTWSTAPANLVQRADSDFVLIGGSTASSALLDAAPERWIQRIVIHDVGLVEQSSAFFPDLIQIRASLSEIKVLAHRIQLPLSLSYQKQLFGYLPSIKSVLWSGVDMGLDCPTFDPDSAWKLDMSSYDWTRYSEIRPREVGLYRRSFEHGPPEYLIAVSSGRQLTTARVLKREWALVAALSLLKISLPFRFDRDRRRLSVSKIFHKALRLPTLLERSFRSGTLTNPTTSQAWTTYEGIHESSVERLTQQLPIFTREAS